MIRDVAAFLDIPIRDADWERILLHCRFDDMKEHATQSTPLGGTVWDEGARVFINRGPNSRWKETLTEEDSRRYEERAVAELGPDWARWLAGGGPSN